jgi:tetratricopeptide (TPR) repeat protein
MQIRLSKNTGIYCVLISVILIFGNSHLNAQNKKKKDKEKSNISENIVLDSEEVEAEKYFVEAQKYFILEDYNKAFILFKKALDFNPENAAIQYKIAETLLKSGEAQKALPYAQQSLKLEKGNKFYYLKLSEIYSKLGNFQEAGNVLENLISSLPGNDEYYYELSSIYLFQKNYQKAIDCYNKIEESFGLNEQIVYQKQRLLLEMNKLDEALAEGKKLIEIYPEQPEFRVALAEIQLSNGRENEAIIDLEKFILENPEVNNGKLYLTLAKASQKAGQTSKAQDYLLKAFADPSLDVSAKFETIAGNFSKLQDEETEKLTLALVDKLVETHPENGKARAVLGDMFYQKKEKIQAREQYLEGIRLGENNFEIWRNVIMIDLELNESQQAIEHSDQALEMYPNQGFLYYLAGTAHLIQKNHQDAAYMLEQGVKLSSNNQDLLGILYGQLGDVYNNLKQFDKSDKNYESALEINPENDHVLNNYSYFLSLRKDKLEQARKMCVKLIKKHPDNPTYLDTYAWVLYNLGEYEQAKKYIEQAVSQDASGTIIEHYGDILYKLGDIDSALKQWQRAKGMDDTSDLIDKKIADRKLYE